MSFFKKRESAGQSMNEEANKALSESKGSVRGAFSSVAGAIKAKYAEKRDRQRESRAAYESAYRKEQLKQESRLGEKVARHEAKQRFERMKQPKYSNQGSLFGESMPGLGGVFSPMDKRKRKKGGGMFDML